MGFIFEQTVGKHRYVFEGEAYRDKDGNPRNRRVSIGKIDPITMQRVYKPEYIERMKTAGTPVPITPTEKMFSIDDIKKSSVKDFGALYLLRKIAEKNGLIEVIERSLGDIWQEVFMLVSFLVVTGDPFTYCEDWIKTTESLPVGSMTSQRISELLAAISAESREQFYKSWCNLRSEREYLALDITSTSSYSELIDDVEWGYNRDSEDLPQINICMLMGVESMLPVYQTLYSGSISDVSTLDTTLQGFSAIIEGKTILAVMDKGFYKKSNIDSMLDSKNVRRFIVPAKFSTTFAKKQVESERKDIDSVENTIVIGGNSLRGVTKLRSWYGRSEVYTHIFYNAKKAFNAREALYSLVANLKEEVESDPAKYAESAAHLKYLNIRKSSKADSGYTVSIRLGVIENELKHCGWLVVISNDVSGAKEALEIYRAKDVVEKGFLRLKRDLDLGRLRVHRQDRALNKVFIGFIALIILSEVHKVMTECNLYRSMTMQQLIRTLSKLRVHVVAGERIVQPVTKTQREIFEAFGVPLPL